MVEVWVQFVKNKLWLMEIILICRQQCQGTPHVCMLFQWQKFEFCEAELVLIKTLLTPSVFVCWSLGFCFVSAFLLSQFIKLSFCNPDAMFLGDWVLKLK